MGPTPVTLFVYNLMILVAFFHRFSVYFHIRLDLAFWLYTVLMFVLFGSCGYAMANIVSDLSTWICIERGGDPFLFERWWWTWIRCITAGIAAVGGTTHVVYRVDGGWEAAKCDFLVDCEEVPRKKQLWKEVRIAAILIYSASFMYARAASDFLLWAKEMLEQGKIDPYMAPPLWHILGPYAVVGTHAMSRSDWVKGKTSRLRTRQKPAEDGNTACEKGGLMV